MAKDVDLSRGGGVHRYHVKEGPEAGHHTVFVSGIYSNLDTQSMKTQFKNMQKEDG